VRRAATGEGGVGRRDVDGVLARRPRRRPHDRVRRGLSGEPLWR
jgi:hypothetical protein